MNTRKRTRGTLAKGLTAVATALAVGMWAPIASAAPGGGGGGHGEDEGFGNNLAMPVLWAEGADAGTRPVLRGDGPQSADLTLDPTAFETVDGAKVYLQREENTWQAENAEAADSGIELTAEGKAPVSFVDWGDNIEVRDPQHPHMLRVETRLLQDVSGLTDADPADTAGMTAYSMVKTNDVTGVGEMWGVASSPEAGTDVATAVQAEEAFLYTSQGCLTIERVDNADTIGWDAASRSWTGDPAIPKCVGEVVEGPGGYGAEVTISGGMTYGYVWRVPDYPAGLYRLTFSLKPESGADFTEETQLYASEETEEVAADEEADESGAPVGNQAVIDPDNNLSYIDVAIDYTSGKPTRVVNLSATRDVEATTLSWDAPVDEGSSPISEYVVNGTGAGATVPEQRIPADEPLTATVDGLVGGEEYLLSVAAVNDSGTGDVNTIAVVPRQAPADDPDPTPSVVPQPTQSAGPQPTAQPERKRTRAQRKVTMRVKTSAGKGTKIRVRVRGQVRSMHGKWVADKGKVKVYFKAKKGKKARVMNTVRAKVENGYTARFHVHKSGRVFAKVVKNAKHKAAKSRHVHLVAVQTNR